MKPTTPFPIEETEVISGNNLLGGMITDSDLTQIPNEAVSNIKNGIYARGQLQRRNGLLIYPIAKPNANKVMSLHILSHTGTGINFLRLTKSTIHKAGALGWTAWNPQAGAALTGGNLDYFSFAQGDNRGFFVNGVDQIMELLPTTAEWKKNGNAPKCRYITMAFDKIVYAYRINITSIPYEFGWSGNLNYSEFDPLVDQSAGYTSLIGTPADVSDAITGVFYLANLVAIPRERSIWLATALPSFSNPFNYEVAVPRKGFDCPRSIAIWENGLIGYNYQQASVYVWNVGSNDPEDITGPVRRALKASIDAIDNVWGTYNYDTDEYTVFIASNTESIIKGYTYNRRYKAWSYEEYSTISTINDLDYPSSSLTIAELPGTIAALTGTITGLGGLITLTNRYFGRTDGEILAQPFFWGLQSQLSNINTTDNGTAFDFIVDSKIFEAPFYSLYFCKTRVEFIPYTTGTVLLQISKDDGITWTTIKTISVITGDRFKSKGVQYNRAIYAKRLMWRLKTSDCTIALNRYDIEVVMSGVTRK